MDDNQQTQVTDDQELANVLAGMNQQAAGATPTLDTLSSSTAEETAPIDTPELQFEETPLSGGDPGVVEPAADTLPPVETAQPESFSEEPVTPALAIDPEPTALAPAPSLAPVISPSTSPELDNIKKDALEELRPLIDKLDLPADEKFDTLLLIIRSTDDKTLVNATFDAAKAITDETKRAQALLDVIKEIDYFSGHGENPAA